MLLEAPAGDSAGLGGLHDLIWEYPSPPARTSTALTVPTPQPPHLGACPPHPEQGIPLPGGT